MKNLLNKSILFLGKKDDKYCLEASKFLRTNFKNVDIFLGDYGDSLPNNASSWNGDYIISYLSRWIVPPKLLSSASEASINFHPASPDYPGTGCINFALYNEENFYGSTCHHMLPSVDTGSIISTKDFKILSSDTVESLLIKTYEHQLILFYEVIKTILSGEDLPQSSIKWSKKAYTRSQLNSLCEIKKEMSNEEINKRIRATNYGRWRPQIKFGDSIFEYIGTDKN
jgi:methionyl-tRNA formyltransferase